ncbi:hypothetical protein ACQU0X_03205 [Pseudovibrio ascidiaceicola]|uniref:hypothetical protein n=1 Tax=Pseudovibrio ascidiaceicola TaxID=285279 RepID=UPI003D35B379
MKKQLFALCAASMLIAGCSSSGSNSVEVRARKAANLSIWKTRQEIRFAGKPFEVAVAKDKAFSFVAPKGSGFPYSPAEVEGVARAVTGCKAEFGAGILAFVGGFSKTSDLREIQSKYSGFNYWRVDLKC